MTFNILRIPIIVLALLITLTIGVWIGKNLNFEKTSYKQTEAAFQLVIPLKNSELVSKFTPLNAKTVRFTRGKDSSRCLAPTPALKLSVSYQSMTLSGPWNVADPLVTNLTSSDLTQPDFIEQAASNSLTLCAPATRLTYGD
jgi:hypothetical protein